MIDIPLHHIPAELKEEFESFLKQVSVPERVILLNSEKEKLLFFHLEQAVLYKQKSFMGSDIKELSLSSVKFDQPLRTAPCLYCDYKGRVCKDRDELVYAYCENLFLEKYLIQKTHVYFKKMDIKSLYRLSKNILEHYNPASAIAHFYIGFCFFNYGDKENYHAAVKNLQKYDKKLAFQLDKLDNLQNTE